MSKKNIKISDECHEMLKRHCDKNGYVMSRFIELYIERTCEPIQSKKVLPTK